MNNNSELTSLGDILIVDDAPNNLRLLSTMLKSHGYQVRQSINGQLALRAAQLNPPDLILLDISMPQMNGYEVCKHLKSIEKTRDIPIIFISALDQELNKVKAFEIGGVDYVTKPFHLKEVLMRVQHQIMLHRLQHQLQAQNSQLQNEVSERKRAEEEIRFLLKTIQSIRKASDFKAAIEISLSHICVMSAWDCGEAWIPNSDKTKLEYSGIYYTSEQKLQQINYSNEPFRFAPNSGLPGRVWLSKQSEWIEDVLVQDISGYLRGKFASNMELKTGLGVPILVNDQVLAVLVLFKKARSQPEPRLMEVVNTVAAYLSEFIQRKKIEAELIAKIQEIKRLYALYGFPGEARR
jgi:DNA-binding response OmpR family regulator